MADIRILLTDKTTAQLPSPNDGWYWLAGADYVFIGSGTSGALVSPAETWTNNFDGGAAATGFHDNRGSPGVFAGTVPYGQTQSAIGFEITFAAGAVITASTITTTNFGLLETTFWNTSLRRHLDDRTKFN